MRLTLRTMLAWLDGVLPETERDELSGKVSGSPVAGKLVERIREIGARPGLSAPRSDGRGLAEDANTVAEFLDNVLPADRIEAFERICIDSDMHLAEAADCHALLAELARDPAALVSLDHQLQQRLGKRMADYLANPAVEKLPETPQAEDLKEAATFVQDVRKAVAGNRPAGRSDATVPTRATGKASTAAWLLASVACLLVVVLAGLLVRSLVVPATRKREVAAAKPAGGQAPAAPAPAPVPPVEEETAAGDETIAADVAAAPEGEPRRPEPADAEPPATVSPVPTGMPAVAPPPPALVPPVAAPVPLPVMELNEGEAPAEPAAPEEQEVAEKPSPPPGAVAEGGVLLHRVTAVEPSRWQLLSPGDPLAAREELAVPEHAFPRLIRGEVSIRLLPGTLAAVVTDPNGTPRLEVVFGKAVVSTEAAEAELGVIVGGLSGVVTLGPRQPIGVAVELTRIPGSDPTIVPGGRRGTIYTSGGIRWQQTEIDGGPPGQLLAGIAAEQPLPPRGGLGWVSQEPGMAQILPAETMMPQWMRQTVASQPPDRKAAQVMAAYIREDLPVEETLHTMAKDRRAENRMVAAATLALLGDYDELVALLCENSPEGKLRESQWEDLEEATVPLALARGANAATRLRQALIAHGPAGRGEELFQLACGLPSDDAAGAKGMALVAALEDPQLVVKRYAWRNLLRLFPNDPTAKLQYRPDRSDQLNDKGVEWWRRKVQGMAAGQAPAELP